MQEIESRRGEEAKFTGTVWLDPLLEAQLATGPRVYRVFFEPKARTHWHAHQGEQVLYVVAGQGRVQKWSEQGIEIRPGDVVHIAAGEKHWHGAAPGSYMIHLAFATAGSTDWLEPVTVEEYLRDFS